MFVSGRFDTTKSKVFYISKQEESVDKIERQQVLLSMTNYLQLWKQTWCFLVESILVSSTPIFINFLSLLSNWIHPCKTNETICLLSTYLCFLELGKIKSKKIDSYSMRKTTSFIHSTHIELEDERFMKSHIYKYDFYWSK